MPCVKLEALVSAIVLGNHQSPLALSSSIDNAGENYLFLTPLSQIQGYCPRTLFLRV